MKRLLLALCATSLLCLFASSSASAADRYWDLDNANAGAGGASPTGSWDLVTANWSTTTAGDPSTNTTWLSGDTAIFSAGTDATGPYTVTAVGDQSAAGIILEEGTLTIAGPDILLNAGTVELKAGTTLITANGGGGTNAGLTFIAGGKYLISGNATLRTTNTGSAGSFVNVNSVIETTNNANLTVDYQVAGVLNIIQTGVIISGNGSLTKTGQGALALASPSTYSGPTVVDNGELRLRSGTNRLPTTTDVTINSLGILNVNGSGQNQTVASLSGSGRVGLGNGTFTVNGPTSTTFSGTIEDTAAVSTPGALGTTTVGGNFTKNGASTLTITGAVNNTGTTTVSNTAGNVLSIGDGGTTGTMSSNATVNSNGSLIFNRSDDSSYPGIIGGGGPVTKMGAGTLTMTNATGPWTNTGGVIVNGGTVAYGTAASGLADTVPVTINDTGTLNMNNTNDTFGSLVSTAGNNVGVLAMGSANLTLGQTASTARTYSGTITGSGTVTKGGGTFLQTLSGNRRAYTGSVVVNLGRLAVGHANALGTAVANTQVDSGAEVLFTGASSNFTISEPFRIAGPGGSDDGAIAATAGATPTLSGPVSLFGNTTLSVSGTSAVTYSNANAITSENNENLTLQGGSGGGGGTISGVVNLGTGSLTKLQGGTWALAGANSYSGGTTISAGKLLANNTSGSATGSGAVSLDGGAIGGTGTVTGPVSTTANGGTIAPGTSAGTFNVTGNVTLGATSHLAIELDGVSSDRLAVGGALDLTALDNFLDVTVLNAGSGPWTIATYGSLVGGSTFETISPGYNIDYGTGTNSQITLTAIVAALLGDFNSNGTVDAADYALWRKNEIPNAPLPNDNGLLTQAERYDLWKANFGLSNPGSGAVFSQGLTAVPEPTTLLLLLAAAGLLSTACCTR